MGVWDYLTSFWDHLTGGGSFGSGFCESFSGGGNCGSGGGGGNWGYQEWVPFYNTSPFPGGGGGGGGGGSSHPAQPVPTVSTQPGQNLQPGSNNVSQKLACAAQFGQNHSIAAAFGAQNNFVANLFGGEFSVWAREPRTICIRQQNSNLITASQHSPKRCSAGHSGPTWESRTQRRRRTGARSGRARCCFWCLQRNRRGRVRTYRAGNYRGWNRSYTSCPTRYTNADECCNWRRAGEVCIRSHNLCLWLRLRVQLMNHWDYIFGPPILAIVFLVFGWPYARFVRAGRPLTQAQRTMLRYGVFFVLGMGYSMALGASLGWQGKWAIALTVVWAMFLGCLAWRGHARNRRDG